MASLQPPAASLHAKVELGNGTELSVDSAPTADGNRWLFHKADESVTGAEPASPRIVIDGDRIRSYTLYDHPRGVLEGAGVGVLIGVGLGAALGFSEGDDHCGPGSFCILRFTAADKAALGAVYVGLAGVLSGAAIGYLAGSRDIYEIDHSHAPRLSATVAPGQAGAVATWSF